MHEIIDTPWNTTAHLKDLKAAGVTTIIRYYNRSNSSKLPEKRVEAEEARAIAEAGLKLAVVFQQRGGSGGHIEDLDRESGLSDATRALELAERVGQPDGSAIYFAVDWDYYKKADLDSIEAYFQAISETIQDRYKIGVYGSGTVSERLKSAGLIDFIWLPAAKGWSGTKDMLKTDAWALYQIWPPLSMPLPHDGNIRSAAWHDIGAFVPFAEDTTYVEPEFFWRRNRAPNTILMEVIARNGLNLRRGPSEDYAVEETLPLGTMVRALARDGDWVKVDVEGDGSADGYMHAGYLQVVSGGFPADNTGGASGGSLGDPYQVALQELALDVREVPGPGNNPRIVMYHNSTNGTDTDDSVAWCSSFVNYCVERAGLEGTDSQWALNWRNWGRDVMHDPREGDIVVWERVGKGGHVGFFRADLGDYISVLGGNQSDRVKISTYPKDGQLGSNTYKLRAIRRA